MHESISHTVGIRLPDLKLQVQSYIAQLKKSLFAIYAKYEVSDRKELAVKVREGKVDTQDSDKAIELLKVINACGRRNEIVIDLGMLVESERQKLAEFFGREIEVAPLPGWITPEHLELWESCKMDLHFLPAVDMESEGQNAPGWTTKLDRQRLDRARFSRFKNWSKLPGSWILIDGRGGSTDCGVEGEDGRYPEDENFLEPLLDNIIIYDSGGIFGEVTTAKSRFSLYLNDIVGFSCVFINSVEEKLKIPKYCMRLPRVIEYSVLTSLYYPEWKSIEHEEWVADWIEGKIQYDTLMPDKHFSYQFKSESGHPIVHEREGRQRSNMIGFRLLAVLPQEIKSE